MAINHSVCAINNMCLKNIFPNRCLFLVFFRNFAIKDGEITPSRQKKEQVLLFCAQLFVILSREKEISYERDIDTTCGTLPG